MKGCYILFIFFICSIEDIVDSRFQLQRLKEIFCMYLILSINFTLLYN